VIWSSINLVAHEFGPAAVTRQAALPEAGIAGFHGLRRSPLRAGVPLPRGSRREGTRGLQPCREKVLILGRTVVEQSGPGAALSELLSHEALNTD
jgi:hypothetical protein